MNERAFVLCGGLGTRLREAVADVPKVLAPIAGRPFLDLFVGALHRGGIRRIVLLAGHLGDQVEAYVRGPLRAAYPDVEVAVSIETTPLGTAGALQNARKLIDGTFLLVNGDTFLELDAPALLAAHRTAGSVVTIAGTEVHDASAFGSLDVVDGAVRGFREKGTAGPGLVNAGVYVLEPQVLDAIPSGRAVSLERETLPALLAGGKNVGAVKLPGSFVDIGTPDRWSALSHIEQTIRDSIATKERLLTIMPQIAAAAELLVACYRAGGKAIFFGNGGSAADAQHLAAEMESRFAFDRAPLPALALNANSSTVTAVGNDYGYDHVFARPLRAHAKPGDVAVAISTSGTSKNVLAAARIASELGLKLIALTGENSGPLAEFADVSIAVPSRTTARIQECHILVGHLLCGLIETALFQP